jgi:mannitol/fructose-specific phosphotransferase system IIA component (Ntr-type)
MRLSELLNPNAISLHLAGRTKRDVLVELVDLLEFSHGFASQGEILDRVVRRESMMSTGLFPGAAIPHGKARSVTQMAAACGLSPEGVDFESEDGRPTHLFVLLVSPENLTTPHVRLLANISRLLKEESVRKTLLEARSPDEFLAAVVNGEKTTIPQA